MIVKKPSQYRQSVIFSVNKLLDERLNFKSGVLRVEDTPPDKQNVCLDVKLSINQLKSENLLRMCSNDEMRSVESVPESAGNLQLIVEK